MRYAVAVVLAWMAVAADFAAAQSTAFTYQGSLSVSGSPANDDFDLQLKLFTTATVGTGVQQGGTLVRNPVAVSDGVFTVTLDFGSNVFGGADRFLEIGVRPSGSPNPYTVLSPRQAITSTPYAIRTLSAAAADSLSSACTGCVGSGHIASVSGSTVTGTIPVPSVPEGSNFYIQNRTTQQAAASFNIAGNGAVAGNLGVGTSTPTSKVEIAAQDALAMTGFQPFLTLRDTNSANKRGVIQSANGSLLFYPNSFIGGSPALTLVDSGNFGVGVTAPAHRLGIGNGPFWTNNAWLGAISMPNASAIGWGANAAGQNYGIGQSTGGLYFFRTESAPGTGGHNAIYIMNFVDPVIPDLTSKVNINADITQPISYGGGVKAIVRVQADGLLFSCYNGVTGVDLGPCGFATSRFSPGLYGINFGMSVWDRFHVISPHSGGKTAAAASTSANPNQVTVHIHDIFSDVQADAAFTLVVY